MSTHNNNKLIWDDPKFSANYKQAEKFTGAFAQIMLEQADFPTDVEKLDNLIVLDQACGTGVISSHIMDIVEAKNATSKLDLTCADFADSMVDAVKARIEASNWRAKAIKADAQSTSLPASSFTHIFFNFGPFLLPSPSLGMTESYRLLTPTTHSILGITSWCSVPWPALIRTIFSLHPSLPPFPSSDADLWSLLSPEAIDWTTTAGVRNAFTAAGFIDVKVTTHTREIKLSVKEFINMLPGSLGLVMKMMWTEEQRVEWKEKAEGWVVDYVSEKYGEEEGGIVWEWTAIVGTGRKVV